MKPLAGTRTLWGRSPSRAGFVWHALIVRPYGQVAFCAVSPLYIRREETSHGILICFEVPCRCKVKQEEGLQPKQEEPHSPGLFCIISKTIVLKDMEGETFDICRRTNLSLASLRLRWTEARQTAFLWLVADYCLPASFTSISFKKIPSCSILSTSCSLRSAISLRQGDGAPGAGTCPFQKGDHGLR